jgi:hypothetical protein
MPSRQQRCRKMRTVAVVVVTMMSKGGEDANLARIQIECVAGEFHCAEGRCFCSANGVQRSREGG